MTRNILPPKTWHWLPSENLYDHVYADDMFGGASYAERVDPYALHLRCKLKPTDTDVEPFCGFHVHLDRTKNPPAVDLSGYNKVYVDLEYSGDNRKLRVYIRDFEQGFSDPDDPIETAKYMSTYVLAQSDLSNLVIDMEEFTVADWWVNNFDVPREHALPGLENVVAFGVDVAYPAALGEHELKLKRVTFEGDWVSTENWYLGILLCWIVGSFIAGTVKLYEFRRLVLSEKAERAKLENYTSALQQEKDQYQELSTIDQLTGLLNRHGLNLYCDAEITEGGEEFLILMPNTPANEALILAERLRQSVMELVHPEVQERQVTISIGVGEIRPNESFDDAFSRADAALYQAKGEGRNRVVRESR